MGSYRIPPGNGRHSWRGRQLMLSCSLRWPALRVSKHPNTPRAKRWKTIHRFLLSLSFIFCILCRWLYDKLTSVYNTLYTWPTEMCKNQHGALLKFGFVSQPGHNKRMSNQNQKWCRIIIPIYIRPTFTLKSINLQVTFTDFPFEF